jgi:hypothetical protein
MTPAGLTLSASEQLARIWDMPLGFLLCLALVTACLWVLHLVVALTLLRRDYERAQRRLMSMSYIDNRASVP